jgi:hypothetical protein
LNQAYERTEEFHLFENFVAEHDHIKPFRTEWRIFDEEYHIAGTIDLISENGNGYEMYDWKRSKKVISPFNGELIKDNQWQCGVGQLADIADTSYNRYCLQQSLYKYIPGCAVLIPVLQDFVEQGVMHAGIPATVAGVHI